ncbi:MAG TPA: galactokinase [Pyrinomonadaceae bacterium]
MNVGSEARKAFRKVFDREDERLFAAPARVNLIGEHTDYNEGFVLPMAIDRRTIVAAAARSDRLVRVFSLAQNELAQFDLDAGGARRRGWWVDYVEGMAQSLLSGGIHLRGADLTIESDVPTGAGLSSSAALEIAAGLALLSVSQQGIDKLTLARAGQQAEHEYVGTNCGIMDQLAVVCGQPGHALLIDCRSLEMEPIPLDTSQQAVVICDSRVKHSLASSEYNVRRAECEQGVRLLQEQLPHVRALRDVSLRELTAFEEILPALIRRRCRHVITENERTLQAAAALRRGELAELGALMVESHRSLRDDYEVSCAELDLLVDVAISIEGVAGARMMGGGFGGCSVNLVRRDRIESFEQAIGFAYHSATDIFPAMYVVEAAAGAVEINS